MALIRLRLITSTPARRERLERAFRLDPELTVVNSGNDVENDCSDADVFVVDLAYPEAALSRFWCVIHVLYPGARLIAMAQPPIDEAALHTALHAGAYYMLEWTEPAERLCRVVRAAYAGDGYIPLGAVLQGIVELFDYRLNLDARSVQIGAVRLELARGLVKLGDEPVSLTPLQFSALVYLARNAGRLVTHAELFCEVWGRRSWQGDVSNRVGCCIKRLRRKLHVNLQAPPYIFTVRGRGYRMVTDREWRTATRRAATPSDGRVDPK